MGYQDVIGNHLLDYFRGVRHHDTTLFLDRDCPVGQFYIVDTETSDPAVRAKWQRLCAEQQDSKRYAIVAHPEGWKLLKATFEGVEVG